MNEVCSAISRLWHARAMIVPAEATVPVSLALTVALVLLIASMINRAPSITPPGVFKCRVIVYSLGAVTVL